MASAPRLDDAPDTAAPFDMLLIDGAIGIAKRFRPADSVGVLARQLLGRPDVAARHGRELARSLAEIALGRSEIAPHPRDRRFADPAWTKNPLLHRILQSYLASSATVAGLADDLDVPGREGERLRFLLSNVVDAAAPSNNPLLNPSVRAELVETRGRSAVRGLQAYLDDMRAPPRVPKMVEPDAYEVGRDLAVTPGAVVARDELYELLQYSPTTSTVQATPLLIVPPTINKYYILDLAPGRSLIEYLVSQGHQVFTISWRNPDERFKQSGLDDYGAAVTAAIDAVRSIAKSDQAHVMGVCSGGIIASMVAAKLAADGDDALRSFSLLVTVLDQRRAGLTSSLMSERTARMAMAASERQGYLDGNTLAEVFAWLRPNDLVWNYWVNNYLLGRKPPAFDILFWNADTVRMPAALHHDFLQMATGNTLTEPGAASILDTPVDLGKVGVDNYVVAGVADHICAWQACFESTQLLGGPSRFVLSNAGHVAALVNPPDNPKASFQVVDEPGPDADAWAAGAELQRGSWWLDLSSWLTAQAPETKRAPRRLGGPGFAAREPAPGTYVFDH